MTIPTITSTSSSQYYPSDNREHQFLTKMHHSENTVNGNHLSPEQKNNGEEVFTDKHVERVENIKSNYQVAKDITLTQAYYEQQQKLLDIYLQSSQEDAQHSEKFNAVGTLTDMYSLMLDLHKRITDPSDDMPSIGQPMPYNSSDNFLHEKQNQLDLYNQTSRQSKESYLHLSA